MSKNIIEKIQTTDQRSISKWNDQVRQIRKDEFTWTSYDKPYWFDSLGKRIKNRAWEQFNSCFKEISVTPAKKDRLG